MPPRERLSAYLRSEAAKVPPEPSQGGAVAGPFSDRSRDDVGNIRKIMDRTEHLEDVEGGAVQGIHRQRELLVASLTGQFPSLSEIQQETRKPLVDVSLSELARGRAKITVVGYT